MFSALIKKVIAFGPGNKKTPNHSGAILLYNVSAAPILFVALGHNAGEAAHEKTARRLLCA